MKKFIYTVLVNVLFSLAVTANFNDILITNIQYDWINKDEVAKEDIIKEIQKDIFESPVEHRHDLKSLFHDRLKDKNYKENYLAAAAGYEEFKGNNISAFYYKRMVNPYMYALQDKEDLSKAFYYDAMGTLRYVDFIEGEYPDYPYYSVQYRITGKPISVIYFASKDCQYAFKPNGDFEGVWYKHKLYNLKNKVILTRTTY